MKTVCLLLLTLPATSGLPAQSQSVRIGEPAPVFALPWASRDSLSLEPLSLSALTGREPIVLAFYPADWSGGCTKEMCTFRDQFADLRRLGLRVYGISGDYPYSHYEWARHHDLPFLLFSDHFHAAARLYGCFNEESGYARRSVFLIDTDGTIAYIDTAFRAGDDESYQKLYQAVRTLRRESP